MRLKDLEIYPMTVERILQRNNINILLNYIQFFTFSYPLSEKEKNKPNKTEIHLFNEYINSFSAFKNCYFILRQ